MDKDCDAVLDEIEAVMFHVALSVIEGEGYSFDVPTRSKSNQMYVPELDRIVLMKASTHKRPFASVQTVKKTTTITTRSSLFVFLRAPAAAEQRYVPAEKGAKRVPRLRLRQRVILSSDRTNPSSRELVASVHAFNPCSVPYGGDNP